MSDALRAATLVVGVGVSLAASWVLVVRLERVGARLGLTEGLLGMLAAFAADAPEITASVTALSGHDTRIGAGVVIGSNVFNLAALLGLAAVVAGRIVLHRRVILFGGAVAIWVAVVCAGAMLGALPVGVALVLVLAVMLGYAVLLSGRLLPGLPRRWRGWLVAAVQEEEVELEVAIHPARGGAQDALGAALALAVVVGASVAMEHAAATLGRRHGVPAIIVGGLVLAVVTSLPNAVAAVYLARRGRGAATLSTALNSNAINVAAGLLLPASVVGLGAVSAQTTFVALSYVGLTVLALACAFADRGLRRAIGGLIILAYVGFCALLIAGASAGSSAPLTIGGPALALALGGAAAAATIRR